VQLIARNFSQDKIERKRIKSGHSLSGHHRFRRSPSSGAYEVGNGNKGKPHPRLPGLLQGQRMPQPAF
jgi:hypothetical protein